MQICNLKLEESKIEKVKGGLKNVQGGVKTGIIESRLLGKYLFSCFPKFHKMHEKFTEIYKKCKLINWIFKVTAVQVHFFKKQTWI